MGRREPPGDEPASNLPEEYRDIAEHLTPIPGERAALERMTIDPAARMVELRTGGLAPPVIEIGIAPFASRLRWIRATFHVVDGELHLHGLTYRHDGAFARSEDGTLRSHRPAELRLDDVTTPKAAWIEAAKELIRDTARRFAPVPTEAIPSPGRSGPSPDDLAEVARIYDEVKSYAETGRRLGISKSTAARWHEQAREHGPSSKEDAS